MMMIDSLDRRFALTDSGYSFSLRNFQQLYQIGQV